MIISSDHFDTGRLTISLTLFFGKFILTFFHVHRSQQYHSKFNIQMFITWMILIVHKSSEIQLIVSGHRFFGVIKLFKITRNFLIVSDIYSVGQQTRVTTLNYSNPRIFDNWSQHSWSSNLILKKVFSERKIRRNFSTSSFSISLSLCTFMFIFRLDTRIITWENRIAENTSEWAAVRDTETIHRVRRAH